VDFRELLEVLWRRRIVVAIVTLITVGAAFIALRAVTPLYESTSTMVLNPRDENDIFILSTLDAVVPVYASAATSRSTVERARASLGGEVADVSVRTFEDTPILKLKARDSNPELARRTAQAVTDLLRADVAAKRVGLPSLDLVQIDQPVAASDPVFPRYGLTLAVALLLGLSFGVAAALLRENLTSKVESSEALAQLAGVPCFAEVPDAPAVSRLRSPEELVSSPRLRALSESLRDLRTNILFSSGSAGSIVLTSPEGSHGKTTVAVGLAITMARAGTTTVLVDCDLRRGRVSEMLGTHRVPGLMELLKGAEIESVVRPTALDTLDLITGGELEANPGELLMAEFPKVLSELKRIYETVVIDTTPLVPVNDARIVASYADVVVIVASADAATRRKVRSAVERLSLISVSPTAVVLNNSRAARAKGSDGYLHPPESASGLERPRRRGQAAKQ
jgi:capsular exopolysaccharide synthesis family protein